MQQKVVAALIVESQKILLGLRASTRTSYPGVWDVFGGNIEPGEQQQQALVRELQEELGITPARWTFLETIVASIPEQRGVQPYQLHLHLYLVTAWSGTPGNTMNTLPFNGSHLLRLCSWILPTQLIRRYLRNTLLLLRHVHHDCNA